MALMRELWSDPSFLELTKKTSATGVADAAGAQPTEQTRDDTALKAQVMTRLAALAGPYKGLRLVPGMEELKHKDQAKWVKKAPPAIAAGGKATIIVKTDMLIRGVSRADTSGWVVYEIVGEDKKNKVRIAWLRKGDGGL